MISAELEPWIVQPNNEFVKQSFSWGSSGRGLVMRPVVSATNTTNR